MDLNTMVAKHDSCVNALDEDKNCETCKHNGNDEYCGSCYEMLLGFPVNPTRWEESDA